MAHISFIKLSRTLASYTSVIEVLKPGMIIVTNGKKMAFHAKAQATLALFIIV